jgi:hypothetical protein
VPDVNVRWHGDTTDPIEIDLLDPSYSSDYYVSKMLSWLANIYTGLTEQLTATEMLVSKSASRDRLASAVFSGLIAQDRQLLDQQYAIYKLAQDNMSQFERMSYNQYTLCEQNTQIFPCQVDGAHITIW